MDIQEIINYSKNKIEADDLAKQVRRRIKETAWEKQKQREGFSVSFKPLISQSEQPVDPKKKNLFTQNQEMLSNQLALTEGINKNRLDIENALTQGFKENQKALAEALKIQPKAITEGIETFWGKDDNEVSNPDPYHYMEDPSNPGSFNTTPFYTSKNTPYLSPRTSSPSPSNPSLFSDDEEEYGDNESKKKKQLLILI